MSPDEKDAEELREELRDYYGTAVFSGMPAAMIDLAKADRMSDEEVIEEAKKNHITR